MTVWSSKVGGIRLRKPHGAGWSNVNILSNWETKQVHWKQMLNWKMCGEETLMYAHGDVRHRNLEIIYSTQGNITFHYTQYKSQFHLKSARLWEEALCLNCILRPVYALCGLIGIYFQMKDNPTLLYMKISLWNREESLCSSV